MVGFSVDRMGLDMNRISEEVIVEVVWKHMKVAIQIKTIQDKIIVVDIGEITEMKSMKEVGVSQEKDGYKVKEGMLEA